MDEKSVWKKEISFRRKPKEPKQPNEQPEAPAAATPESEATSMWKKELSFRRKPKSNRDVAPAAAEEPAAPKQSIWKKEISLGRKRVLEPEVVEAAPPAHEAVEPVPPAPDAVEAAPPAPAAVEAAPLAFESVEPTAPAPEVPLLPEEAGEETHPVQTTEPEVEPTVPVALEPEAPFAAPEPTPVAYEHPAAPPTDDLAAHEHAWTAGAELPLQPAESSPPVTSGVQDQAATVELPVPVPLPAPVVHPPVSAAELPPLPEPEVPAPAKPVPFWKREIAIGRRGASKAEQAGEQPKRAKEPKPKRQRKERRPKEKRPKLKVDRGSRGGKKLVGLKIGASQLAAARVSNNGSAELLQVAREPLSPGIVVGGELRDPDALAFALKDFFAKHKLPKRGVRLGIANNRIGVRTFDVSGVADQKLLDNAIRFRAQETLPIPIDEAVLDYHVLDESTDQEGQIVRRILLVVAYREQIDRYVDACKKAGIQLVGIDLEAFALLRALQAPVQNVGEDASALVAVAIGHERSTFAVSDGRVCEFTRVLDWGGAALNVALARALDAAPSEVEAVKRELSLVDESVPEGLNADQAAKARDAVRRAVQSFARELVSSLQFYQNQPGSLGIGEIVLTGGTAHLPGLAAELERMIGVHVRNGDPLARIKVSKRIGEPQQVGSLAVAIGLGIED